VLSWRVFLRVKWVGAYKALAALLVQSRFAATSFKELRVRALGDGTVES
jgi:hypothetical protein